MGQLTIEQKAKHYDEALEKARQLCFYPTTKPFISDLQDLFPELAESGGEKIRKEIITYLSTVDDKELIPYESWIAWLEKQGEQILANSAKTCKDEQKPNPCDECVSRKGCINCENGELREIEQKPIDKVEPFDEYEGLTDFERTLADICIGWIGQELGWKQYIKDNADVLLKIAIKKFNSVQDTIFEQKPIDKVEPKFHEGEWAVIKQ